MEEDAMMEEEEKPEAEMMEDVMVMVSDFRQASGILEDTTRAGDWLVSGNWNVDCGSEACSSGALENIILEMEHSMVRPDGVGEHSHSYGDFAATGVTVSGDELIIEGTVSGSGPIGDNSIVIRINLKAESFAFELPENGHLQGELEGMIIASG